MFFINPANSLKFKRDNRILQCDLYKTHDFNNNDFKYHKINTSDCRFEVYSINMIKKLQILQTFIKHITSNFGFWNITPECFNNIYTTYSFNYDHSNLSTLNFPPKYLIHVKPITWCVKSPTLFVSINWFFVSMTNIFHSMYSNSCIWITT